MYKYIYSILQSTVHIRAENALLRTSTSDLYRFALALVPNDSILLYCTVHTHTVYVYCVLLVSSFLVDRFWHDARGESPRHSYYSVYAYFFIVFFIALHWLSVYVFSPIDSAHTCCHCQWTSVRHTYSYTSSHMNRSTSFTVLLLNYSIRLFRADWSELKTGRVRRSSV